MLIVSEEDLILSEIFLPFLLSRQTTCSEAENFETWNQPQIDRQWRLQLRSEEEGDTEDDRKK